MEYTPLKTASSRVHLNIDQDRKDETRNIENSEEGNFPASHDGKPTLITWSQIITPHKTASLYY